MEIVLAAAVAWLVGDLAMEGLLWVGRRTHIMRTDAVRSLGSLYRHSFRNAMVPGLVIHLLIGAALTGVLAVVVAGLPVPTLWNHIGLGSFFGVVVGVAVCLALSELLPSEPFFRQFPARALEVAVSTVPGYLMYGTIAGVVFFYVAQYA